MAWFNSGGLSKEDWVMSNHTVIDYHHQTSSQPSQAKASPWQNSTREKANDFEKMIEQQLQLLNTQKQPQSSSLINNARKTDSTTAFSSSYGNWCAPTPNQEKSAKYNPFDTEDMEISDEENPSNNPKRGGQPNNVPHVGKPNLKLKNQTSTNKTLEIKSGASFYKGLILFIPPFEQLSNTYRGSPAMKMLYASFEFSLKMPIRIETKPKENDPKTMVATVMFQDHVLATGSGCARPHVEASVRALEVLSETCYTIQAKEDYFVECKLISADTMKTLNLKKWEAVTQKHPDIIDITKESHIQKTFAVFLDSYTSSEVFQDIVCCNLTRADVSNIKSVVEFFKLNMLPCSISTNLSKKETPCVVTIHKYTTAQKLLDVLIKCGGENKKFKVYPPDTFKDFYKLHPSYWDSTLKGQVNKNEPWSLLENDDIQAVILKPFENIVVELFEKHKSLPIVTKSNDESVLRKVGDDFMKETLKIDMADSKNMAPVERMQLLLKYMEQLQEYGSRVLTSGRQEMIKIYHNAIDNLRKDLDSCRKDIEKEQKGKSVSSAKKNTNNRSKSPVRRRSPLSRRSRSPSKWGAGGQSRNRSVSPKRKGRSRSPKRPERRRSVSPKQRPRSKSPRRRPLLDRRYSPPARKSRSPLRKGRSRSPARRPRSPRQRSKETSSARDPVFDTIFKDQFRRFVEIIRRFRIEIEDTPIERRHTLKDKLEKCQQQLHKFHKEVLECPTKLGGYVDEIEICEEELNTQAELIAGKPGPNDIPRNITPPPWMNVHSFEPETYPRPALFNMPSEPGPFGARIPPPAGLYPPYRYPY